MTRQALPAWLSAKAETQRGGMAGGCHSCACSVNGEGSSGPGWQARYLPLLPFMQGPGFPGSNPPGKWSFLGATSCTRSQQQRWEWIPALAPVPCSGAQALRCVGERRRDPVAGSCGLGWCGAVLGHLIPAAASPQALALPCWGITPCKQPRRTYVHVHAQTPGAGLYLRTPHSLLHRLPLCSRY